MLKKIKECKKEFIYKVISSLFLCAIPLIIPIYYSKTINDLSKELYVNAYKLIIVSLLLSILYYIWNYINQHSWYKFYNKLYMKFTNIIPKNKNKKNINLGEYTNIVNSDVDIICTFFCNIITRIIQILEFLVIYIYFYTLDIYIFLVTIIISLIMMFIMIKTGKNIQEQNRIRKENFDNKTIFTHELYGLQNSDSKIQNNFINSTVDYLKANFKFNVYANAIIYLVLAIIEITRYSLIFYGVYLVSLNRMEIGTILLIYTYYSKIVSNFEVIGTVSAEYQSFKVSLKRFRKLEN